MVARGDGVFEAYFVEIASYESEFCPCFGVVVGFVVADSCCVVVKHTLDMIDRQKSYQRSDSEHKKYDKTNVSTFHYCQI